mmetsp:Transcript_1855/g.2516  ORF Transcript_1855/g.2516 Transcript_1855/m.2516 type:complete len:99 (-) Transcript_1855:616-912(-)
MNNLMLHINGIDEKDMQQWADHREMIADVLNSLAVCLRLSRCVSPFLQDKKGYLGVLVKIIKNNLKDAEIIQAALMVFKMLLCNGESVKFVSQQYPII